MRLFANPVFREGIQVYFIEARGFGVYGICLAILALLQCLVLFLPPGDPRIWLGPAYLFKFSAAGTLVLSSYFILRISNQEFATWRFQSVSYWFKQEKLTIAGVARAQVSLLCLHILIFHLLALPLLGWAGAIERTPLRSMAETMSLLVGYSFVYGGWGLFALAFWDHSQDSRRVFVRCLLVCLLLVSGLLYLALNPVAFLMRHHGGLEIVALRVGDWSWEATTVHGVYHFLLFLSGFGLYGWALKRTKETYSDGSSGSF